MLELKDHPLVGPRARSRGARSSAACWVRMYREEGALPVRAFEGRSEPMWGWKPEKRALRASLRGGRARDRRTAGLPARLRPARARDPGRASRRAGAVRWTSSAAATRCARSQGRGALTESGIAEHCRFKGGVKEIRPHVDALVADGLVERVEVDDGGPPVVVPAGAELDGAPSGAVLLCPFDNLMWDRPFLTRLFGFEHLIEVYKREPERVYGYYVLPLLVGDRFVGRADLKADRARGRAAREALHAGAGRAPPPRRPARAGRDAAGALARARVGRSLTRLAGPA